MANEVTPATALPSRSRRWKRRSIIAEDRGRASLLGVATREEPGFRRGAAELSGRGEGQAEAAGDQSTRPSTPNASLVFCLMSPSSVSSVAASAGGACTTITTT